MDEACGRSLDDRVVRSGLEREAASVCNTTVAKRPRRILVIDDRPETVAAMQCVLELAGHEVDVAYDGQAAIQSALALRPDVILCDIELPGHDEGHAVAEAVRASSLLQSTYMVAVTGCAAEDDVKRAVGAGFDLHVAKPVDMHVLIRLIDERFEECA
jgi:CheY-like chemotaxis protein